MGRISMSIISMVRNTLCCRFFQAERKSNRSRDLTVAAVGGT